VRFDRCGDLRNPVTLNGRTGADEQLMEMRKGY
jgi:hypothetical protein